MCRHKHDTCPVGYAGMPCSGLCLSSHAMPKARHSHAFAGSHPTRNEHSPIATSRNKPFIVSSIHTNSCGQCPKIQFHYMLSPIATREYLKNSASTRITRVELETLIFNMYIKILNV